MFSRERLRGILHMNNFKHMLKCLSALKSLQMASDNPDLAKSTAVSISEPQVAVQGYNYKSINFAVIVLVMSSFSCSLGACPPLIAHLAKESKRHGLQVPLYFLSKSTS